MSEQLTLPGFGEAEQDWQRDYEQQVPDEATVRNRSGVAVKPIYTPRDWSGENYLQDLGFPGQAPMTRGIHASMYRGRSWSQRLVVGLGTPPDYNQRMHALWNTGITGLYLAPCNSHMRGYDADEVPAQLLGTCGTSISTVEDVASCVAGLPFEKDAISLGDTAPFTLSAMLLAVAKQRGIPWAQLTGTTNQSDYLSHYAALHMFFRLALPGARRLLMDHVAFMTEHCPRWNPISIVGQHMQQAGATPAEAMAFTLSSAVQHADDLVARGFAPDDFLPRFSFFFDISISFFEEVAKFRAGRRLWARIARERYGAKDPRSGRFRFHAQTSGTDLTRQQPLNNIARVAVQGMAGVFGGLQSLHTDSYDEALGSPSEETARIAVNTQNILSQEAHLDQVIDPFGGSYYVERLTDDMEAAIEAIMAQVAAKGGMFAACEDGLVQRMIGASAMAFQQAVESGEQPVIGVNAFEIEAEDDARPFIERPDPQVIEQQIERVRAYKANRDQAAVDRALDELARVLQSEDANSYAQVVEAAMAGASHGEICARVRDVVGFGEPLVMAS